MSRIGSLLVTGLLLAPGLGGSVGLARQPMDLKRVTSKDQEGVRIVRALVEAMLESQKQIVNKFKALPEADDIRMNFGTNFYGWSVSSRKITTSQQVFESAMAAYEKDFKGEELLDELRIYLKRIVKTAHENQVSYSNRLDKAKAELRDGKTLRDGKPADLTDGERKTDEGLLKMLPLELEFQDQIIKIYVKYYREFETLLP